METPGFFLIIISVLVVRLISIFLFSQMRLSNQIFPLLTENKIVEESTIQTEQPSFQEYQEQKEQIRLTAHEFIPVGETRYFGNIGGLLEVMQFGAKKISVDKEQNTVTCLKGGIGCIRAKYRDSDYQNNVQTKCIACIDETGSCTQEKKISFDFQQFANRNGNSNWLESGDNLFYGVCEVDGKIRLQQSTRKLPPLYLFMVDALGNGAYSLGEDEYDWQRMGLITTFSGKKLKPSWITYLGGVDTVSDTSTIEIDENGNIAIKFANCNITPECSFDKTFVKPGDIVQIGSFPGGETLIGQYAQSNTDKLDGVLKRYGITSFTWNDLYDKLIQHTEGEEMGNLIKKKVQRYTLYRLISLEVFEKNLHHYDKIHDLKGKNVSIVMPSIKKMDCVVPDPIAQQFCDEVEENLTKVEKETLERLKKDGFTLWISLDVDKWPDGTRPFLSNFDGMLVYIGRSVDNQEEIISFIEKLNEIVPDIPVMIVMEGAINIRPAPGVQCEADFCPSDFKNSFIFNEIALYTFLKDYKNIAGVAVETFDGAHFDIKHPIENKSGYELNRVGETGYNNPILNIYTSQ